MGKVITGLFNDGLDAARAIDALQDRGIASSDISVLASDPTARENFGLETHSKLAEGAAIGAGVGGAVGAVVAGLTAVGVIATGGIGLVAAGPIVAALAGAGAGAAGGSVLGGLVGVAIPETEVHFYEDAIGKGAVLVGVHSRSAEERDAAKEIFKVHNAMSTSAR